MDENNESNAFDPFFDYSKLSEEDTENMRVALSKQRGAANDLIDADSKTARRGAAERLLKAQQDWHDLCEDVLEEIFTVPVMVHEAGPKKAEEHPEDDSIEIIIQRCTRCASPVQMWQEGMLGMTEEGPKMIQEDEIPWWNEGDVVAKATHPGGIGMYEIDPKRKLEPHEKTCVGLPNL